MKNKIQKKHSLQKICGMLFLFSIITHINYSLGSPRHKSSQLNLAEERTTNSSHESKKQTNALDKSERNNYAKAIEKLSYIIQHQKNGLPEHDNVLGNVSYLYPKAPGKPITFASYKNLPIFSKASISITKHDNDAYWTMARIRARGSSPKFLTEFSKEMFTTMGLVFLKKEEEDTNKYFVYQTNSSPKILLKFYVEASHLADAPDYPKNFEFVDIVLNK